MADTIHTAKAQGRPAWATRYRVSGGWAHGALLHGTTIVREYAAPLNHAGAFAVDVRTERDDGVRVNFLHKR